ncbi:MAG: SAM-dependent methyltransferase [Beijerinckiaceae bacterium]|jgi:hypothetical protein|nr:SAM-dependent methyltransferase [Beijerinckiaceae bacterium]
MTGFSADWLSLREPVDHASINAVLRDRMVRHFANTQQIAITDLGSGSGSSLRGLAPFFPEQQFWRLLDHDQALLNHARIALTDWADEAQPAGERLHLKKGTKSIIVECVQADLAQGVPEHLLDGAHMITASAFFDLVSVQWIERFCRQMADVPLPVYALLTYNGSEQWMPRHPADAAVLAAFHQDQQRDKGFGPAAGPEAAAALSGNLAACGYSVEQAPSPWVLGSSDAGLIHALAAGSAAAVADAGLIMDKHAIGWREARQRAVSCTIGHTDVLALPD